MVMGPGHIVVILASSSSLIRLYRALFGRSPAPPRAHRLHPVALSAEQTKALETVRLSASYFKQLQPHQLEH